jgi:hypothetical protein
MINGSPTKKYAIPIAKDTMILDSKHKTFKIKEEDFTKFEPK